MTMAWRLGLLLALVLAPFGCAHQSGARAPGGAAVASGTAGGAVSGASLQSVPTRAAPGEPGDDDLSIEEEFDLLDAPTASVADPLRGWNRAMFTFNDKFYFWFLKPVSKAYRAVVPSLARTGVENFFNNLGAPRRFVSNALQLKGREATIELGKFMINSTWGVLGFGNLFADNPETKIPEADLGLAMAHHGVGQGAFVVWPFLGPYTLRDSVGWAGGLFLDPVSFIHPFALSLGTRTYSMVNYTSFRIGDYEALIDASIDPYLATRDAYLQNRAEKSKE
jgi:phospholipid-binding lipoprotein MlaA